VAHVPMDGGVNGGNDSEMHVIIKPGIEGVVCTGRGNNGLVSNQL